MAEKIFADGIIAKRRDGAPDYATCNLSINVEKFRNWLTKVQDSEWVNLKVMKSPKGSYYVELDTWKPERRDGGDKLIGDDAKRVQELRGDNNPKIEEEIIVDDIPF